MWRLRWKTSYGLYAKLRLMIDSLGDVIIGLSASIAAGSGLSAWRLLRRVQDLEKCADLLITRSTLQKNRLDGLEQRVSHQSKCNEIIEDRLEALEEKPAPKQEKKMGTPRHKTEKVLLYGRTPNGP